MTAADPPQIGTLNEGGLHRGIKDWLARPGDRFEVPMGSRVIDLVRDDLLIEIQTGALSAMGRKLDCLLDAHRMRIVHPIPIIRWLEQPGKPRRKSPKRKHLWNIFDELVSIPTLLDHPNLELEVLLVEETEVRSGTDLVRRGRRGRVVERRLEAVIEHRRFVQPKELLEVLPANLEQPFLTSELARTGRMTRDLARRACYVLRHAGLITEVGRTKKGIAYQSSSE